MDCIYSAVQSWWWNIEGINLQKILCIIRFGMPKDQKNVQQNRGQFPHCIFYIVSQQYEQHEFFRATCCWRETPAYLASWPKCTTILKVGHREIVHEDDVKAWADIVFSESLTYSLTQPLRTAVKVGRKVYTYRSLCTPCYWNLTKSLILVKPCFGEKNTLC